jgi:hypothetical protein
MENMTYMAPVREAGPNYKVLMENMPENFSIGKDAYGWWYSFEATSKTAAYATFAVAMEAVVAELEQRGNW